MSGAQGKHTPGPWTFSLSESGGNFELKAGDVSIVDGCGSCGSPFMDGPALHNARLIAEAPNLLAALIAIMKLHCPYTGTPTTAQLVEHWEHEREQGNESAQAMLDALAAIAKATGETA